MGALFTYNPNGKTKEQDQQAVWQLKRQTIAASSDGLMTPKAQKDAAKRQAEEKSNLEKKLKAKYKGGYKTFEEQTDALITAKIQQLKGTGDKYAFLKDSELKQSVYVPAYAPQDYPGYNYGYQVGYSGASSTSAFADYAMVFPLALLICFLFMAIACFATICCGAAGYVFGRRSIPQRKRKEPTFKVEQFERSRRRAQITFVFAQV